MSYLHTRYRRRKKPRSLGWGGQSSPGLGGWTDSLASMFSSGEKAVSTAIDVAQDPYLPEVICRIGQLHAVEHHKSAPSCPTTPVGIEGGVGLGRLIYPLRAFVYAEENRWVYPAAAAVLIGLPLWLGYQLGKGRKSGGP